MMFGLLPFPPSAHAQHLAADPTDLTIPAYNGLRHAPIGDDPGMFALWRGKRLIPMAVVNTRPKVELRHDNTRAHIHTNYLAHHRECASTTCISVWEMAARRARAFGNRTFVLTGYARLSLPAGEFNGNALITAMDDWLEQKQSLLWAGLDRSWVDNQPELAAYDITPEAAQDIDAGREPSAPRLRTVDFIANPD